ncbi:hypothetical protein ACFO4N_01795 [Camelliibacillus cellulosilyticus]|uniref:Uncharacterized protein n=1 Tax=Camelliibacillus cellulosilyticus TaxID=2174486 RepID=A0ABV9GHV5_9BACL
MEIKLNKKQGFGIILLAVLVAAIVLYNKPWEKYKQHGPLAQKDDGYTQSGSPNLKPNVKILFGGASIINKTSKPITIISVEPTNIPRGIKINSVGISKDGIGLIYESNLGKPGYNFTIESLPFKIPPKSKDEYLGILNVSSKENGKFVIQGLIITYKYGNKLYRDYYRDQLIIYVNSPLHDDEDDDTPPPPEKWSIIKR